MYYECPTYIGTYVSNSPVRPEKLADRLWDNCIITKLQK